MKPDRSEDSPSGNVRAAFACSASFSGQGVLLMQSEVHSQLQEDPA